MVEYHYRESGICKTKRSLCSATAAVLFLLGLSSLCLGAGDGPPHFQVEQDWKTIMKNDPNCGNCVRLSRVAVKDMEVRKNTASVRIEVVGDWVGLKDCHSAGGPCSGFSPAGGISQVVTKTVRYKKYDSGWQIETRFGKSQQSGRQTSRKR